MSHAISSSDLIPTHASVLIIGAGVAGVSLAHALSVVHRRTNIVVIDRGTLFATGGSSSHAPGGCLILHPTSDMLTKMAKETVTLFAQLGTFNHIDEFILARTQERLEYLREEEATAQRVGLKGVKIVPPLEVKKHFPMIDDKILKGALFYPKETGIGRASAVKSVEAMAEEAHRQGGAHFFGNVEVVRLLKSGDSPKPKIEGVELSDGRVIRAATVVVCAGAWSIDLLERVGVTNVPVINVEHQWMLTDPLPELSNLRPQGTNSPAEHQNLPTSLPAIFDSDTSVYIHQFGDRLGFGNYDHRGLLVDSNAALRTRSNTEYPFSPLLFRRARRHMEELMPSLAPSGVLGRPARAFHGLMSFAPDGLPVVGPIEAVDGLWLAVGVWVMYSVGIGKLLADWIARGQSNPPLDLWNEADKLAPNHPKRWDAFVPSTRDPNTREAIRKAYEDRSAIPIKTTEHQQSKSKL